MPIHPPAVLEKIRRRAYEIWDYNHQMGFYLIHDRGIIRGRTAQDDWLEAEREILQCLQPE